MNYVTYKRVSTTKQGGSGLGIQAQQSMIDDFLARNNGSILAEFTEVESGKKDKRPQLNEAIRICRENNCELIIAKLDRLSRNISFVFALRDSGVRFIALDIPEANTLTIGIMAVFAQHERELTSKRTKDALRVLKIKGVRLGNPLGFSKEALRLGIQARKEKSIEINAPVRGLCVMLKSTGLNAKTIAEKLNADGYRTPKNKIYYSASVIRLLNQAEQLKKAS